MAYFMNGALDATEYVEMLSPSHGWMPFAAPDVAPIYRGHSNGSYPLVPNSLRNSARLQALVPSWTVGNLRIPVPAEGDTFSTQVTLEYLCLRRFFDNANSHALPLPDYTDIKAFFDSTFPWGLREFQKGEQSWPPDVLLPLMALGQHYELPTRLLDWTDNPYFAAYFSAKSAAARYVKDPEKYQGDFSWDKSKDKFFVVWGLDVAKVKMRLIQQNSKSREMLGCPESRLRVITAPAALIPNLAAQKGLFTLYESGKKFDMDSPTERISLDSAAVQMFPGSNVLYALVCPISEARRVLYLLAYHGISAATVYPGYKGVVTSIEETSLLERFPRNTRWARVIPEISAVPDSSPPGAIPQPSPESGKTQPDSSNLENP